jgi:hypothetical protein
MYTYLPADSQNDNSLYSQLSQISTSEIDVLINHIKAERETQSYRTRLSPNFPPALHNNITVWLPHQVVRENGEGTQFASTTHLVHRWWYTVYPVDETPAVPLLITIRDWHISAKNSAGMSEAWFAGLELTFGEVTKRAFGISCSDPGSGKSEIRHGGVFQLLRQVLETLGLSVGLVRDEKELSLSFLKVLIGDEGWEELEKSREYMVTGDYAKEMSLKDALVDQVDEQNSGW